jgi:glycerol-3-phosphate dehydrogenase
MERIVAGDLPRTPVDSLVIGAGINGCGIARDAALRGLRVALVDQRDVRPAPPPARPA